MAVYFDPIACLMALYTERSIAHLIVATDCIAFCSALSKSKDADLGKCGRQKKFISEVTGLLHEMKTMASVVTKLLAIDSCKHPSGLLVVGNKTNFAS
jgi:hypothetical protein